jgi:hypothetical protein
MLGCGDSGLTTATCAYTAQAANTRSAFEIASGFPFQFVIESPHDLFAFLPPQPDVFRVAKNLL